MLRNAAFGGHGRQTIERRETFRSEVDIAVAGDHIEASPFGRQLASRTIFSGEETRAQRTVCDEVDSMCAAPGNQFTIRIRLRQIVDVLAKIEGSDSLRRGNRIDGSIADADASCPPDLPFFSQR